ncbi:MAG TPA: hypothetical protein VI653_00650 [Steroidobacteraceae bacterium]
MTLQEFAQLFPESPFALRYVEQGARGERKFVWHIQYTNDYWTSDTCRAVYDHSCPPVPDGFGDSPEAAIEDLLKNTLVQRQRALASRQKELGEAHSQLAKYELIVKGKT